MIRFKDIVCALPDLGESADLMRGHDKGGGLQLGGLDADRLTDASLAAHGGLLDHVEGEGDAEGLKTLDEATTNHL